MLKKMFIFFICLMFLSSLLSCQQSFQTGTITNNNQESNAGGESEIQQIKANNQVVECNLKKFRDLWNEKKITNYNLLVRYKGSGFSAPASPVIIKVRNSQPFSTEPVKEDESLIGLYNNFNTVEKIFEQIQADLEGKAVVDVVFNSEFGYPKSIEVNYAAAGGAYAYYNFYVDSFEVVEEK